MHEDRGMREAAPTPGAHDRGGGRARHCWEIVRQIPGVQFNCEECYAYFVQQDCWTLWALRRPGFKPCCQKKDDCAECVVLAERMRPQQSEYIQIDRLQPQRPGPSSAKRICTYLQLFAGAEEVATEQRTNGISRALQMRNADLRCRLRGVHLDVGYVNDVCVSRQVDECVFLDDVRPDVHLAPVEALKQGGLETGTSKHPEQQAEAIRSESSLSDR